MFLLFECECQGLQYGTAIEIDADIVVSHSGIFLEPTFNTLKELYNLY